MTIFQKSSNIKLDSDFLPYDFRCSDVVALLAGNGIYPILCAQRMIRFGVNVKLIALEDEADDQLLNIFDEADKFVVNVGNLGRLLKILKFIKASYMIMAGQIRPKKLFHGLKPDWRALFLLRKLKIRNAETIFGSVCDIIEKHNIKVLDARSFMDEDMVSVGPLTGRFDLKDEALNYGIKMAREVAKLDIGQGVVVKNGTVLCVEEFDGTDGMLRRASKFNVKDALFVKTSKLGHDFRFDVPVFGMRTLDAMIESGIKYAALESDCTIVLDSENVLARANQLDVRILGY
ncbi:MAG: UDP-2,3-diacylglucosamine diphosphatase LpxI [Puniceicoccales bacterium]|jgi:DUF1009 family protein|nr:UDP-2,3-diacylglucosamine diphosphatase LpxI [Puniceicoccales bacterium]